MEQQTHTTPAPAPAIPGGAVKVARTFKRADGVDVAVLAGHLVKFSTHKDPDLTGDFFTSDTDFGTLSRKGRAEVPGYYQHGFDPHFKGEAIGDADLSLDEFGVWAEYQIELRSDYERHLVEMAGKGLMGQSSGAVGHLVEYEQVGGSYRIKRWPIGEASLTPTPAEPRTSAAPVKSAFRAWAEAQAATAEAPPAEPDTTKTVPPDTPMENQTPAPEANAPAPEAEVKTAPIVQGITKADMDAAIKAAIEDARPAVKAAPIVGTPAIVKSLGDTEAKAFKAWALGDDGAMSHAASGKNRVTVKASNDTDMNVGTAADGGNAVPTGHFGQIIARRDESRLDVGVMDIPGVGLTVNVPLDAEDDGEFVSTGEAVANDRDAPALGTVAMTLVKYTKRVELSDELLQDEESRLMEFLANFVGRGMAKTHNSLLITELNTNGTALKTTTSSTVLAAGELEDAVFGNNIANYLGEGSGGGNWIMAPATYAKIASLTGSDRVYASSPQGGGIGLSPTILGSRVNFSSKCEVYGTTAKKFAHFGNFNYVGRREEPAFEVLRDPYSAATTGQLRLHYYFRTVYKVLQAEAVGHIKHA